MASIEASYRPRPRSGPAAFEPTPFADPDAHLASRSARPHRPGGENDAGAAAPDEDSDTDVTEGLRYVYRKRKGEAGAYRVAEIASDLRCRIEPRAGPSRVNIQRQALRRLRPFEDDVAPPRRDLGVGL